VHAIGKGLQVFGLMLLPAALIFGLSSNDPNALGKELAALAVGAAAFFLGTRLLRR
jgi:hypothetical protein